MEGYGRCKGRKGEGKTRRLVKDFSQRKCCSNIVLAYGKFFFLKSSDSSGGNLWKDTKRKQEGVTTRKSERRGLPKEVGFWRKKVLTKNHGRGGGNSL